MKNSTEDTPIPIPLSWYCWHPAHCLVPSFYGCSFFFPLSIQLPPPDKSLTIILALCSDQSPSKETLSRTEDIKSVAAEPSTDFSVIVPCCTLGELQAFFSLRLSFVPLHKQTLWEEGGRSVEGAIIENCWDLEKGKLSLNQSLPLTGIKTLSTSLHLSIYSNGDKSLGESLRIP